MLLSNQLNNELALTGPDIEVNMNHLLPCAQGELAIYHGDRQGWDQKRRARVAVPVAITPARVVRILTGGRENLVKEPPEIHDGAGFELDGCQRAG
jgi:hypothetical protein